MTAAADAYKAALQRAVKLLSTSARTVEELRESLLDRYEFSPEVVERVIERLRQSGYLNDPQLAHDLAESRLRTRPIGSRRLKHELSHRKLPEAIVERTVRQTYERKGEKELIDEAVRKRISARGAPRNRQELKNLYDHLLRLGFDAETVGGAISRLPKLPSDLIE